MKKVTFKSTGIYRCEVTTRVEGGQWVVKESTQKMVVVGKTRKLAIVILGRDQHAHLKYSMLLDCAHGRNENIQGNFGKNNSV